MGRKSKNNTISSVDNSVGVDWAQCSGCDRWELYENWFKNTI